MIVYVIFCCTKIIFEKIKFNFCKDMLGNAVNTSNMERCSVSDRVTYISNNSLLCHSVKCKIFVKVLNKVLVFPVPVDSRICHIS